MLTSRHLVNQQFNTVHIVMSNRLNPNKGWVNLCESRLQKPSSQGDSYSCWTPRLPKRILCRMTLSARNRLVGKIVELQLGGVMAHVVVRVGENLIESVITKRSADEMKLKVGDMVSAIIKSTEVMLEKD
jgi:molybdopterin-binding protein